MSKDIKKVIDGLLGEAIPGTLGDEHYQEEIEFLKFMEDNDNLSGFSLHQIGGVVRKKSASLGWDDEKIYRFAKWFVNLGAEEGWLLDQLGF